MQFETNNAPYGVSAFARAHERRTPMDISGSKLCRGLLKVERPANMTRGGAFQKSAPFTTVWSWRFVCRIGVGEQTFSGGAWADQANARRRRFRFRSLRVIGTPRRADDPEAMLQSIEQAANAATNETAGITRPDAEALMGELKRLSWPSFRPPYRESLEPNSEPIIGLVRSRASVSEMRG
jgi:hypothetical protein